MDFTQLNQYCKDFSNLTPDKERLLRQLSPDLLPHIPSVTDAFYAHLFTIDATQHFLEGRLHSLKAAHQAWLMSLFTHDFDEDFAAHLYHIGDVHVKVQLPSDFMTGAITCLQEQMLHVAVYLYGQNPHYLLQVLQAINSALGYNLQLMQLSYQESMVTAELNRFLKVTGISHKLFTNMLAAYKV